MTADRARAKGREVQLQTFVDVSEGKIDQLFAKSTECKSVTTADYSAVDAQIEKALIQVAGKKKIGDREDDHRVIDVIIENVDNSWPYTTTQWPAIKSAAKLVSDADFIKAVEDRLKNRQLPNDLVSWLKSGQPMNGQFAVPLRTVPAGQFPNHAQAKPNSSRLMSAGLGNNIVRVATLTIKIRYKHNHFPLQGTINELHSVCEVVFQISSQNYSPQSRVIKIKKFVQNRATKTTIGTVRNFT